jgi:hypothetical protein
MINRHHDYLKKSWYIGEGKEAQKKIHETLQQFF